MNALERAAYVKGLRRGADIARARVGIFETDANREAAAIAHIIEAHADFEAREAATPETPLIESPRPGTPTSVGAAGATEQSARSVSAGSNPAPGTVSAETPGLGKRCETCSGDGKFREPGKMTETCPTCSGTGLRDGGRTETREVCVSCGGAHVVCNTPAPPPSPEAVPTPFVPQPMKFDRKPWTCRCNKEHAADVEFCRRCKDAPPWPPKDFEDTWNAGLKIEYGIEPAPVPVAARERAHALLGIGRAGVCAREGGHSPVCDRLTRNEQAWQQRVEALERLAVTVDSVHVTEYAAQKATLDTGARLLRAVTAHLETALGRGHNSLTATVCVHEARAYLAEYDRDKR